MYTSKWEAFNNLTDHHGCAIWTDWARIECDFNPEEFAIMSGYAIQDNETCHSWWAEKSWDYGCDYRGGTGEINIEDVKEFSKKYLYAFYIKWEEEWNLDWQYLYKDA